jgi:hypothetical protein
MDKVKIGAAAGVAGFALSFLVALASRARLPWLAVRPVVFGGLFFLLGMGAYIVFRRFLTVDSGEDSSEHMVDISVEDDDSVVLPTNNSLISAESYGFSDPDLPENDKPPPVEESVPDDVLSPNADIPDGSPNGIPDENTGGLEQNAMTEYTEERESVGGGDLSMDFGGSDNMSAEPSWQPDSSSAEERKGFRRVPEMDTIKSADPKRMAGAIQNLLTDE